MRWLAALVIAAGCGQHDAATPPSCASRCVAYASSCSNDTSQCDSVCRWITDAQLTCLEQAKCDHDRVAGCLPSGAGGGAGAVGASGSGGGGAATGAGAGGSSSGGASATCLGLGESGCSNAAEGKNCCAPGTCDDVKGVCCVQKPNMACKVDGDCCGNAKCSASASGGKVCAVPQ